MTLIGSFGGMFGTLRIIFLVSLIFDLGYNKIRELYIQYKLKKINKKVNQLTERKQKIFGTLYFIVDTWKDRIAKFFPHFACWILIIAGEAIYANIKIKEYEDGRTNPNCTKYSK